MDPLKTYNEEIKTKTGLVTFFCCDKKNVLEAAKKINKNSFYVCEGYDELVDKPHDIDKEYDISFIGNVYGTRKEILSSIESKLTLINNAYGAQHAKEVSKSRINLNLCTDNGASDRVYKIMSAGGMLLTNDWHGRSDNFVDGEDCVVFKDVSDLNEKINFYLKNKDLITEIANNGYQKVKNLNRKNWASKIVEISNGI